MRLDCVSLALMPSWRQEQLIVVRATDSIRLCSDYGYEQLPTQQAPVYVDSLQRQDMPRVRAFVSQTRLSRFPLSALPDHALLALLRKWIKVCDLVVLRECEGDSGGEDSALAEQRRLVREIEAQSRRRLAFAGRQYKLVADLDLRKLPGRDSYEVVRQSDAVQVLDALAGPTSQSTDLATLLAKAREKLTRDWRPPLQPAGLILLRRVSTPQAYSPDVEPAITPSQMKNLVTKTTWAAPKEDVQAPQTQGLDPPVEASGTNIFEVIAYDQFGSLLPGVALSFDVDGGDPGATTDQDGVARLRGASKESGQVTVDNPDALWDLLVPRWTNPPEHPDTSGIADATQVLLGPKIAPISIMTRQPKKLAFARKTTRVRLIGMHFDHAKTFMLPSAIPGIKQLVDVYAEHQNANLLVVGHTDTRHVESAEGRKFNRTLSLDRAKAIVAYLKDDVDVWYAWYEVSDERRWGHTEDVYMLSNVPPGQAPYYQDGDDYVAALKKFQTDHGQSPTGKADKATRRALITDYMNADGTTLPPGETTTAHGCGPYFPDVPTGPNNDVPANRRVEIFVFDGPIVPPPSDDYSEVGSTDYPAWIRQVQTTIDFSTEAALGLELHADYDNNGQIQSADYGKRTRPPGSIAIANIDVDSRTLPTTAMPPTVGDQVLDFAQQKKVVNDNDFVPIEVRSKSGVQPAGSDWRLEVSGAHADAVRIFDAAGAPLPPFPGVANAFAIQPVAGKLKLQLEVGRLAGSPLTPQPSSGPPPPMPLQERDLLVTIAGTDAIGAPVQPDNGHFTIAPLLLGGGTRRAERLYIADIEDDGDQPHEYGNRPGQYDVQTAVSAVQGVSMVRLPLAASQGDSWMQDQFQEAYCYKPAGWMRVILHLPRLRSNAVHVLDVPNLISFVSEHFPSKQMGIVKDFHEREIRLTDVNGKPVSLRFRASSETSGVILRASSLWKRMKTLMVAYGKKVDAYSGEYLYDIRRVLPDLYQDTIAAIDEQLLTATQQKSQLLVERKKELDVIYNAVVNSMGMKPKPGTADYIIHFDTNNLKADLDETQTNRLEAEIDQMGASYNYGGNIEASPPLPGAKFGKILVGNDPINATIGGVTYTTTMDASLLSFFEAQKLQPVVSISTQWLHVGHVDEIVSFVPDLRNKSFAIVRASPNLAFDLLSAAQERYTDGVPSPQTEPTHLGLDRSTSRGTSPVTHLFRGKYWLYHNPPNTFGPMRPPRFYQIMAEYNAGGLLKFQFPYEEGSGIRSYYASMNVFEVPYYDADANQVIESEILSGIDSALSAGFPGIPILRVPVIYDTQRTGYEKVGGMRIRKAVTTFANDTTGALSPNCANLQVVNDVLLVPRPFGPRMRIPDVIAILTDLAGKYPELAYPGLDKSFFVSRKCDKTVHWARKPVVGVGSDANVLAGRFEDGFHGVSQQQVAQKIMAVNPGHFDGNGDLLQTGTYHEWHRLIIPEGMVDLFEACVEVVAARLKVKVQWIDSWFYHVRAGEIHCGTNVIHVPPNPAKEEPWW